jgi:sec-independent protein translocase protein TatB
MFDFAWSELGLIALVSVLVLGPKQLPETMRTMAKVMRRVRSLGAEFQGHVNEMIREAELQELRDQVQKLSSTSVTSELTKMIDPTGEVSNALAPPEIGAKPEEIAPPPAQTVESTPASEPPAAAPPTQSPPPAPGAGS